MCGCTVNKTSTASELPTISLATKSHIASPQPKAIAYKMIGDASAANVPVQVDNQGNIISFPDPSDLENAEPIQLQKGYLLDRRGVNTSTRFLHYTYSEYSALQTLPSPAELQAAIIPNAKVAEIVHLPISVSQAVANIDAVNAMLP